MNKIILSVLIILLFIYIGICDPPVNPDDFPTEVRDSWETVNQLRELPEPTFNYVANSETTIIDSNSIQQFIPFIKDSLYDNSISLRHFINANSVSSACRAVALCKGWW
ncbi:MAG: hypothetical protein RAO94_06310 [Candidatus Stygibacter australis]|nr:hypothetical protein [Candidatus Stygibacter australis]